MNQEIVCVYDNDGVLYDCPPEFERAITEKMIDRIAKLSLITIGQVRAKRLELFQKYNIRSTLLVFYHEGIIKDIDDFIEATYLAVDPNSFGIRQNHQLREKLQNIDAHLLVHTNNPSSFAKKILECVGIEDFFVDIYGMFENDGYQKPDPRAFQNLLRHTVDYTTKWYVDNEKPNLTMAAQFGFKTVLI